MPVEPLSPAEGDTGSEYMLVDARTGEPIDIEALEAQAKPAEEWTLEEVWDTFAEQLGWTTTVPDPVWVEQVVQTMTRAHPAQAGEYRRVANFVLSRHPLSIKLAPCRWTQRGTSRERRPSRRRSRGNPRRARAPGPLGDDEPPPELELARLRGFAAANERLFRHVERRIGSWRAAA
jgi:hypothetical protein